MDSIESPAEGFARSARGVRAEDIAAEIRRQVGDSGVEVIYRKKVLSQRTRRYDLPSPPRPAPVEILHTLLGIELKIANQRLLCPDLATARYLAVFARLGCESVALPYDITRISRIADELESGWQRTMLLVDHLTAGRSERLRALVRRRLVSDASAEIARLGSGSKYPQFDQKTRQRR